VIAFLWGFACKATAGTADIGALLAEAVGLLAGIEKKSRDDIRRDIQWRLSESRPFEMRADAERRAAEVGPAPSMKPKGS
jgi:hypothetical protein